MANDDRHVRVRWPAHVVLGLGDVVDLRIGKREVVLLLNGVEMGRSTWSRGYAEVECSPRPIYTPPAGFEVWE